MKGEVEMCADAMDGDRWVVGGKDDAVSLEMTGEGLLAVTKRVLVSPDEGWDGWVMRLFDIAPGGHTPRHSHAWPHINFVAAGSGELFLGGLRHRLQPGSYAFVPGGHEHQFTAAADEPLSFVCIVPSEGEY
jgi:quercetin dioxygenase-like cupin family protein